MKTVTLKLPKLRSSRVELWGPPKNLACLAPEFLFRKMIIKRLLTWHRRLPNNPQFDSSIEVFRSHGGYGIRAIRDLNKSQTIVRVPAAGWLEFSADRAVNEARRSNPQFYELLNNLSSTLMPNSPEQANNLMSSACLATKLIIDKREALRHPYVEFLNQTTSAGDPSILPHTLSMSAIEVGGINGSLSGSTCHRAIMKRRELYNYIGESIFGPGNDMVAEFKWGMGIVLSRAVSNFAIGMPFTLVPILDLANHSRNHNASHDYNKITGEFSIITTDNIRSGDEVFINYGTGRDTASFMSLYGFCEESNPNDKLDFQLRSAVHGWSGKSSPTILTSPVTETETPSNSMADLLNILAKQHGVQIKSIPRSTPQPNSNPNAELLHVVISSAASLSVDFLLSIEKSEYKQIIDRLLKFDSGSAVEGEKRLMLCEAVAAAAHSALGDNVLGRARDIAAFHTAATKLLKNEEGTSAGAVDLVKSEFFSVQLILDSIDKSIEGMLAGGLTANEVLQIDPAVNLLKSREIVSPPLVAAAEARLLHLYEIAESKYSPLDSVEKDPASEAAFQWRSNCAAVSASELDGLLRLRFLCTAYHISLLSST